MEVHKLIYKIKKWFNHKRGIPPPFFSEIWFGVYDTIKEKTIYLYPDKESAENQARRGAKNWLVIEVICNYEKL